MKSRVEPWIERKRNKIDIKVIDNFFLLRKRRYKGINMKIKVHAEIFETNAKENDKADIIE